MMIEDEYDKWEQKKRDVMYHLAVGDSRAARRRIDELLEYTFTDWSDIREAKGEPSYPEETGRVVHTKTL